METWFTVQTVKLKRQYPEKNKEDLVFTAPKEESLKDLDYEDAKLLFISEGFEYVQLVNKHDLIVGLLKKEGKVESISINGETNFSKGSWFPPDAIVKITYHGF